MTAFWDLLPCSLVEVDRRFGGAYCIITAIAFLCQNWHAYSLTQ
jgi:hypothetical protein